MVLKRIGIFILFMVAYINAYSQFYIVEDKDGYTNVRDKNKKVIGTIDSGEIAIFEIGGDIDGMDDYIYTTIGYIHSSRLLDIALLKQLPIVKQNSMTTVWGENGTFITVERKRPDPEYYKVATDENGYTFAVGQKRWWCTFPELPSHEYKSIIIDTDSTKGRVPHSKLKRLESPDRIAVYRDDARNRILVLVRHCANNASDHFSMLWVFEDGEYSEYHKFF